MAKAENLLSDFNRIQVPFIKVTIGDYTFGIYQQTGGNLTSEGIYTKAHIVYPNYVQSLDIIKINGQVNQYTLSLIYPIRTGDDPNFFEKVFSSVKQSRKIIFSYGDCNNPDYIYKDEEAIITKIRTSISTKTPSITYTLSAVSCAIKSNGVSFPFTATHGKPSTIIKQILSDPAYNLKSLFYGMTNTDLVDQLNLIDSTDASVDIPAPTPNSMSALEYIKYLVGCMIPEGTTKNSVIQKDFYVLTVHDEISGETVENNVAAQLGGPYFKVERVNTQREYSDAYYIDIGYPSKTGVLSFDISQDDNYSIYYDWQENLDQAGTSYELLPNGDKEEVYSPTFSRNIPYQTTSADLVWWTKMTQYPISAVLKITGLIRPATLMQYLNINTYFFGAKHISSGVYIITKQQDRIDRNGYITTFSLTRVKGTDLNEV